MDVQSCEYGVGDNSYRMAGELAGITALVDEFYRNMDSLSEFSLIRTMHPESLAESRQKLSYFLSGWLGGPKRYADHYGPINIPEAHRHLRIGDQQRDGWIACMQMAVDRQDYEPAFKTYLMEQLRVPAERIRVTSLEP
ncbi:MAG: group II truncated hemoglobin [Immundisolibacteraceae bacterium]|nr:group II truncated hemoglobin [Immundisolibacteraceae bacterium]